MIDRENTCKACEGSGMLADDEGWQYACKVCGGGGVLKAANGSHVMEVDPNNRLLD
ncbi:hypothetical protein MKY41_14800 [Sporosarcina sp. FSL W7-1349]|uniref:hypothetical protein n=1 Tax=Sporosarcina sp. FSL W7-1349 TaxID=2921561 RepID=UPI0030F64685